LNYAEFKALLSKYSDKGLVIQAFPCNQFGFQEPGTNEEIKRFAESKGFLPEGLLMDKVKVNGSKASPVFEFLKVHSGDSSFISWNLNENEQSSLISHFLPQHGHPQSTHHHPQYPQAPPHYLPEHETMTNSQGLEIYSETYP
jgi:glutathione peroxidase-family protein